MRLPKGAESVATFEDYCEKRWGWNRDSGYRYIKAAGVAENVLSTIQKPPSLTQAVELAPLTPVIQREVAAKVDFSTATVRKVRRAQEHGFSYDDRMKSHVTTGLPKVFRISTNQDCRCPNPNCGMSLGDSKTFDDDVNHVISEGYEVKHIGTESYDTGNGLFHYSVAHLVLAE